MQQPTIDETKVSAQAIEVFRLMDRLVRDAVVSQAGPDIVDRTNAYLQAGAFVSGYFSAAREIAYSIVKRGTDPVETTVCYLAWVCVDRLKRGAQPGSDTKVYSDLLAGISAVAEPFIDRFDIDHLLIDCSEYLKRPTAESPATEAPKRSSPWNITRPRR